MAKKQKTSVVVDTLTLPKKSIAVDKDLFYTKDQYTKILQNTLSLINSCKIPEDCQHLYGIYYNAFAGLVRSGALVSRETGIDGTPDLNIQIGDENYRCPESVVVALFGKEAEYLIHPWKDEFSSYFDGNPFMVIPDGSVPEVSSPVPTVDNTAAVNAAIKSTEASMKKQITELENKIKKLTAENAKLSKMSKDVSSAPVNENTYEDEYREAVSSLQESQRTIKSLEKEIRNITADRDRLQAEQDKANEEKNTYVYDPNYDHYYSDVLPKLIDSIEFTHTDLIINNFCIALSAIGIVLSAIFIL